MVLKLPLVAEQKEIWRHKGIVYMERQAGDLLNPHGISQEDLKQLKAELAPHVFAAQQAVGDHSEARREKGRILLEIPGYRPYAFQEFAARTAA